MLELTRIRQSLSLARRSGSSAQTTMAKIRSPSSRLRGGMERVQQSRWASGISRSPLPAENGDPRLVDTEFHQDEGEQVGEGRLASA
jgi:hypothetical protein